MVLDLNSVMVFLLVSCRMAGVIFFNPIFGKKTISNMVKVGISLTIAYNATFQLSDVNVLDYSTVDTMISMIKEFAVGFAMGFIMQLFLAVFNISGELIDLQMGISMATMYDPSTNSQVSITGNMFIAMYTLLFFITNSHITMLAVAVKSYDVIPIGFQTINPKIASYMVELFGYILVYAVQLALPVIITEILIEVAVGVLMRVVPNINVFVVNLQLKLAVGLIVIFTIIPVVVNYLQKLNTVMLERMQDVLTFFM